LAYVEDGTLAPLSPSPEAASPAPAERDAPRPTAEVPVAESQAHRSRHHARVERKQRKALGPATTLRIAPGSAPVATVSLPLSPTTGEARPRSRPAIDLRDTADAGVPTLLAPDFATRPGEPSARALQGIEVVEMAPVADAPAATDSLLDEPEFVRASTRKTPRGFSIVFTGGSLLLAILVAAQLAVIYRADLSSSWPSTRPVLLQLCNVFGCTLGWPTQPDQLAVIGSELQSIAGTDVLELTAVIRNRAPFTQALPALEVTLSDTQNRPVARKVFTPADYLVASGEPRTRIDEGLAPGADMTIRLYFEARGLQAAGFLVYPFFI